MPTQATGEMSARMMTLLGVVGALLVALVLAVSHLSHHGAWPMSAPPQAPAGAQVVPQMGGLGYQDAQKLLAGKGVAVGAVVRVPSARHADTVVRTYPDGGTTLRPGDRVTLYVSSH
jgi:PASTA domain